MKQTLIEKIVQKHAVGLNPDHTVQSGDFISIQSAINQSFNDDTLIVFSGTYNENIDFIVSCILWMRDSRSFYHEFRAFKIGCDNR